MASALDAVAGAAALFAAGGGIYGSIETESAAPAGFALSFVAVFVYALHRVQASAPAPPKNQIVLVLLMIALPMVVLLRLVWLDVVAAEKA